MNVERAATVAGAALLGAIVMLLITGDRLTVTTALLGAGIVGLIEWAFLSPKVSAGSPPAGQEVGESSELGPNDAATPADLINAAPDWHATAMTDNQTGVSCEPRKPAFERSALSDYLATAQRDPHQCPNCARFTVSSARGSFSCQSCRATWRWRPNDHWPNVLPQPHLQEVT